MVIFERLPLLALGAISLAVGILTGWWRMGWNMSDPHPPGFYLHGAVMAGGFFGTLINLERAVSYIKRRDHPGKRWAYLAPALSGLSLPFLMTEKFVFIGGALITLSSFILFGLTRAIMVRRDEAALGVMSSGAFCWAVGNLLWLSGRETWEVIWFWLGFVVLIIVGERLELNHHLPRRKWLDHILSSLVGVCFFGIFLSAFDYSLGAMFCGAAFLGMGIWLLFFDLARVNFRKRGINRFVGVALWSGYIWLAVSGIFALLWGGDGVGLHYDAILHTLFLGFAFAMIFGHGPVIFPGLVGIALPYHPIFYTHLILLHLSVLVRITGDLMAWPDVRIWGGLLNGVAIALFIFNTILAAFYLKTAPPPRVVLF